MTTILVLKTKVHCSSIREYRVGIVQNVEDVFLPGVALKTNWKFVHSCFGESRIFNSIDSAAGYAMRIEEETGFPVRFLHLYPKVFKGKSNESR